MRGLLALTSIAFDVQEQDNARSTALSRMQRPIPAANSMPNDLCGILTPDLYGKIIDYQFPWSIPVNVSWAITFIFEGIPDHSHEVYDTVHRAALKPLSKYNPNVTHPSAMEIPSVLDFMQCLPNPNESTYLEQALALILLLDQAPRILYQRLEQRWTYDYFSVMARSLVRHMIQTDTCPDSTVRWMSLGYPFEDAFMRKMFLYVPLVHSEDLADHGLLEVKNR